MQQYLEAGKLVTTHGVAGELKMEVWCDGPQFLKRFKTLYLDPAGARPVQVEEVRAQKNMALLRLQGVEDIEGARALVGKVLYFARSDAALPEGQCFMADLIGCRVEDAESGRVYGTVTAVQQPGPQLLYTVKNERGKEYLLPDVPAFVRRRLPEEQRILVTPIPGLLDDGAAQAAE